MAAVVGGMRGQTQEAGILEGVAGGVGLMGSVAGLTELPEGDMTVQEALKAAMTTGVLRMPTTTAPGVQETAMAAQKVLAIAMT